MDKLAISNIAWTGNEDKVFKLLSDLGVTGVEVAPGKIAGGWERLNVNVMKDYKEHCANFGLVIPSFQAFLFGKPELQLLGDKYTFKAFKEHIKYISELAAVAGAEVLVFGAPKNRKLLGNSYSEAQELAKERLAELADICWQYKVSIGLEAVPESYGGEIIKSYRESFDIVNFVNNPGLVMHLDTGCTFLNDESIDDAIKNTSDYMKHFHISQPGLGCFTKPAEYNFNALKTLSKSNYKSWKCIEMLETEDPMASIKIAIEFYKKNIIIN